MGNLIKTETIVINGVPHIIEVQLPSSDENDENVNATQDTPEQQNTLENDLQTSEIKQDEAVDSCVAETAPVDAKTDETLTLPDTPVAVQSTPNGEESLHGVDFSQEDNKTETKTETDDSSSDSTTSLDSDLTEENAEKTEEDAGYSFNEFKKLLANGSLDEVISQYGYDNIFEQFDTNKDGVINEDEVKALNLSTGTISDLTVDDIKKLASAAGLDDIESDVTQESNKTESSDTSNTKELSDKLSDKLLNKLCNAFSNFDNASLGANSPMQGVGGVTPSYGAGGVSGGGAGGGSYGTGGGEVSSADGSSKPDEMSMDKLLKQQKEKQSDVNDASQKVAKAQGGENENVKAAQNDKELKEKAYLEAVEKDENISDELKKNIKENQDAITDTENQISEKEEAITKDENKIYNCENSISSLDNKISALNSSLSALPKKTDDNKDQHADIDSMKESIEKQIQDAQDEKTKVEGEKTDAKTSRDANEDDLGTLKDDLADLKKTREELQKELEESASDETKQALKDFQEAETKVETVKQEELKAANAELKTAKEELEKVNESINELEAMQLQLKNRVGGKGEDVVDFAKKLDGLSASEMREIMQKANCQFDNGAWCADFVTYVTKQVYGNDATPGNFAKSCSNTAYCPTIESWAQGKGVWTTKSSEVEPGDYILYTRKGRAGHIGIVTSVNKDGSVNTIEGNTSDDNGNYTSGVVNQHSNVTSARGFVKMHELK